MELAGVLLGRGIAFALFGDDVHKRRPVRLEAYAQRPLERSDVVAVDGSGAYDAELLEEHLARNNHLLERIFGIATQIDEAASERAARLKGALNRIARAGIFAARAFLAQIASEGPDISRDRHLVVVQNNDHGRLQLPQMIERLEGHAARKRGVADDRNDLLVGPIQIARHSQAERHRKRIARMARWMHIVGAFRGFWKPRNAAELAERIEGIAAARHDFVRIRLVAHIEKQLVMGAIEHAVACQDELDHAQARGDVPARFRCGGNNLLANFASEYGKLLVSEELKVRGGRNHIKNAMAFHKGNPLFMPARETAARSYSDCASPFVDGASSASTASSSSVAFMPSLTASSYKSSAASSERSSPRT